jgi:hypothetical protein
MFWRVHNYDLTKKVQLSVAVGRNDNYDLKKKCTVVWQVHKYVRKKRLSHLAISGNLGGFHELGRFGRFIITT